MTQLRELLRIRDYRYLWTAQVISDFGDSLTSLTLLILIQRITGSTVALAGLLISITLPALLIGTVAGVYVDRFDRKRLMIISDVARAAIVLLFLFARTEELVPVIYALAFAQSAVGTLFRPARGAFLPAVVGEEKLLAANSVSQTSMVLFNVLGTTAAGLIAAVSETLGAAFVLDSITFLVSALLVSRIATPGMPEKGAEGKVWAELKTGVMVMLRSRHLRGVIISVSVLMLGLGAVNVLMVPFLLGDLGVSEAFFGAIEASQVAGMVISGTVVAILAARLKPSSLISLGLLGIGVTVGIIGGITVVWQLMIVLFLVGLSVGPAQAGMSTLSQTLVKDSMRGRVGGVLNALISAATVVSMGLAGGLAAAIGTRNVFLLAGVLAVVASILVFVFFRGLSVEEQRGAAPLAAAPSEASA
ncbi:MAG: MFS transporter [Acidimicrobiia bacterium]|nr:MFS transporter [Acidimicrobiia bacterium]